MREIISINIGKAGVNLGDTSTQQYCLEHNIQLDGSLKTNTKQEDNTAYYQLFEERANDYLKPRSIFVDTEPEAMNEIRIGKTRQLYHPQNLISGKQGSNGNYASGHEKCDKEMMEYICDAIRKKADHCTGLQGFMIHHGVGGGTGSGLAALIYERLSVDYGKKSKLSFPIFPDYQNLTTYTEPYNALFSTHFLTEHGDSTVVFDNEAVLRKLNELNVKDPTYPYINIVLAQYLSLCTSSLRYEGSMNVDLTEFQTNLVPYPRINFLIPAMAELQRKGAEVTPYSSSSFLTQQSLSKQGCLVNCDPIQGKYMACCLYFKGGWVPKDICPAICAVKTSRQINFVDWAPTGFKCGIDYHNPKTFDDSPFQLDPHMVCSLSNNTGIQQIFQRIFDSSNKMYEKRAFVGSYVAEGMEEGFFSESLEDVKALLLDYKEVEVDTLDGEDEV